MNTFADNGNDFVGILLLNVFLAFSDFPNTSFSILDDL